MMLYQLEKISNNLWEIGVHIADVSHYVKENSLLDYEAQDMEPRFI